MSEDISRQNKWTVAVDADSGPEVVVPLDDYEASRDHLNRIVATLESDADLEKLPPVRAHLLDEVYRALRRMNLGPSGERAVAEWRDERERYREALQRLYDWLPRYSCKADAPDGCPVCQARETLKGPR